MDVYEPRTADSTDLRTLAAALREQDTASNAFDWTAIADDQEAQIKRGNEYFKDKHEKKFPFNDNLFTLIFVINSQLSEQQRTLSNVTPEDAQYRVTSIYLQCYQGALHGTHMRTEEYS